MKNKDYIEKAKKLILNRVRFHAPIVYDDNINFDILSRFGVDVNLPVFKFDKTLSKNLAKAFTLAKKEENFNLLLSDKSASKHSPKGAILYSQSSSLDFLRAINKLNINYSSSTNFNPVFQDKFFKVDGQILNPQFDDFKLKKVAVFDKIYVDYTEFVLNGSNFYLKISNQDKKPKKVEIELNIPLVKGYYFFKRFNRSVLIENLLTKQKLFLNFICPNAKFSFSCVDGLENSVFSCVNVRATVNVEEESFVFFNFGAQKFNLKNERSVEAFQNLARRKVCDIFNVQVKTKNAKFDYFFNKSLPQKIWVNWLNGDFDKTLEEKYLSLKRLFVRGEKNFDLVNFKEVGLKELGIFNGQYYKKVLFLNGKDKFLRVGRTFFYNINRLNASTLKTAEPVAISFGE